MSELGIVGLGCLGGALPDVLRVVKLRHEPAPEYLKRWFFWISLVVLVALGGIVTFYVHPEKAIEALSVGFCAPAIVSKLLGSDRGDDDDDNNDRYGPRNIIGRIDVETVRAEPKDLLQRIRLWWTR
jgi:hypothetical protein